MNLNIKHLVIIGTGLIGGSLALALRQAGVVERITGVGRSAENLKHAMQLGVVDDISHDASAAVADADVVLIAVPVGAYEAVFVDIAEHLRADAIVTDVGSTKQSVLAAAQQYLKYPNQFVPGHPIAGTEHSGAAAALVNLFQDKMCILTPDEQTNTDALARVEVMWQCVGANVEIMDARSHDGLLASVSHLPHLAAFSIVNAVRQCHQGDAAFRFAAGGFRDFTRIASSSPTMWRDIALCNRSAIVENIDALQAELSQLKDALQAGNGDIVLDKFESAKHARDAWLAMSGDKL